MIMISSTPSWLKKYEYLWKKEIDPNEALAVFKRLDVEQFFNALNNMWHPSTLVRKIGGWEKLDVLYKDPDIYAAIGKRQSALVDTKMTLEGPNEALNQWFTEQLGPHERKLKKDFWWSVFNGYGIEQIIYEEDMSGKIKGFQREDFWRFEVLPDLIHAKLVFTDNAEYRGKIVPYGKFVVTVNDGSASNPHGDSMGERLITPWIFKCTAWDLWIDFAKRFANGFLHSKISDINAKDRIYAALERAGKSSILVTDKDTETNMISPPRDSSLYAMIDEKTVRCIQKIVLGETLTSDQTLRGSTGAAEVHNDVRVEKTMDDIDLVQNAINETIYQIALVNGFDLTQIPKCVLNYEPRATLEIVTRDKISYDMGVRFNKQYYVEKYGMNPDHFEVVDTTASSSPFGFSRRGKTTYLSRDQMRKFIGMSSGHKCPVHNLAANPEAAASRKGARQEQEKEDIVAVLNRTANAPLDVNDLISAIQTSKNEKELDEKLVALFDTRNNAFVDDMTNALYYSLTLGAMLGNPQTVKTDEEE